MSDRIDSTWIAWAFERPPAPEAVEAGLHRVRGHYSETAQQPLVRSAWMGDHHGMAAFRDPGSECRWPHWIEHGEVVAAFAYPPTGWHRIVGWQGPTAAAAELAERLWQRPERAAEELDAPMVTLIAEPRSGRMVIVNDRFGAGRIYQMRTERSMLWSNRLGALPLFAGTRPRADRRGWALLAAAGWFMSDSTAISGARKAPPGVVIEVAGPDVAQRVTGSIGRLLTPGGDLNALTQSAAEQATDVTRTAAELFPDGAKVELSGGHDSRIGAAAAIAAGVPVRFSTSDTTPGEADVARQLLGVSRVEAEHEVTGEERKRTGVHIRERARRNHLLHDGMMHASQVKSITPFPPVGGSYVRVAGHGGELGHGFYYKTKAQLERIRTRGEWGLIARLMRSCKRHHRAGTGEVYDEARASWERLLAAGREHGVEGMALLDWCYMMDRFAHRSGLASSTQRVTVFATPAFIEAAFTLTPEQRCDLALHRGLLERLVPEWNDVPYFHRQWTDLPEVRRERIWEGEDVEGMEEMLREGGPWEEMFKPDRARKLWQRARQGEGHVHFEDVYERIAYRVGFDDHLALLGERARREPERVPAASA